MPLPAPAMLTICSRRWTFGEAVRVFEDLLAAAVVLECDADVGLERLAFGIDQRPSHESLTILCLIFGRAWHWDDEPGVALVRRRTTHPWVDLEGMLQGHAKFAPQEADTALRGLLQCVETAREVVSTRLGEVEESVIGELREPTAGMEETGRIRARTPNSTVRAELEDREATLRQQARRIERMLEFDVSAASRRTLLHRGEVIAVFSDGATVMTSLGSAHGIRSGSTLVVQSGPDVMAWIEVEQVSGQWSSGRLTEESRRPTVGDKCRDW